MALYKFDENKIIKSSAVDENGYHRDGGNVFVEDLFPMGGNPNSYNNDQYWFMNSIFDHTKHNFPDAKKYAQGLYYIYFGNKIDDSKFELGLNGNTVVILNRVDLNLLVQKVKGNTSIISGHYSVYAVSIDTTEENNSLPENWRELKAHLVIPCRKIDDAGNFIENNYGVIQIHQR